MIMNVQERLVALNLLPKEGNFTNLKLIRIAKEALSFDEEENRLLNFQQVGNQLVWNQEADIQKKVTLGEVATMMLIDVLKKLNTESKLKDEHFSLYEKFVENREGN
jgi:hypothetical protein